MGLVFLVPSLHILVKEDGVVRKFEEIMDLARETFEKEESLIQYIEVHEYAKGQLDRIRQSESSIQTISYIPALHSTKKDEKSAIRQRASDSQVCQFLAIIQVLVLEIEKI